MMMRCRFSFALIGMGALLVGAVLVCGAETTDAWQRIGRGGFAAGYNPFQYAPNTLCVFKGKLYTATGGVWGPGGGQVWQYDGSRWTVVMKPDPSATPRIMAITTVAALGDYLYAAAYTNAGTCEVLRTRGTGAAPYAWARISGPNNLGLKGTYYIAAMVAAGNSLYAGTSSSQGGRIWRFDGTAWTQIIGQGPSSSPTGPGFGTKENSVIASLAISPSGELLAGTYRFKGCEVWREASSGWVRMNVPGFGTNKGNFTASALAYLGSALFAMTENSRARLPGPEISGSRPRGLEIRPYRRIRRSEERSDRVGDGVRLPGPAVPQRS